LDSLKQSHSNNEQWEHLEMEKSLPMLHKDPWWIRYKSSKIAFGELS